MRKTRHKIINNKSHRFSKILYKLSSVIINNINLLPITVDGGLDHDWRVKMFRIGANLPEVLNETIRVVDHELALNST